MAQLKDELIIKKRAFFQFCIRLLPQGCYRAPVLVPLLLELHWTHIIDATILNPPIQLCRTTTPTACAAELGLAAVSPPTAVRAANAKDRNNTCYYVGATTSSNVQRTKEMTVCSQLDLKTSSMLPAVLTLKRITRRITMRIPCGPIAHCPRETLLQ